MSSRRNSDADRIYSETPIINYVVWRAACSSAKARDHLMDGRVRALYRDTEFWGPLVSQSDPAIFVDRLHAAILNLIRHTTLNETWLRDAYTAKSVVELVIDDVVGGLFEPLMSRLTEMVEQAESADLD